MSTSWTTFARLWCSFACCTIWLHSGDCGDLTFCASTGSDEASREAGLVDPNQRSTWLNGLVTPEKTSERWYTHTYMPSLHWHMDATFCVVGVRMSTQRFVCDCIRRTDSVIYGNPKMEFVRLRANTFARMHASAHSACAGSDGWVEMGAGPDVGHS